jgi:hypothetical protein
LILQALIFYLLLEPLKISILPILFKELLSSSIFERLDIFKIIKTNSARKKVGVRENKEILLKIKNK